MTARIHFKTWGCIRAATRLPEHGYALARKGETQGEAVARSLARRLGLVVGIGPRDRGAWTMESHTSPALAHFDVSFGKPRPDGNSYLHRGSCRFSIPQGKK